MHALHGNTTRALGKAKAAVPESTSPSSKAKPGKAVRRSGVTWCCNACGREVTKQGFHSHKRANLECSEAGMFAVDLDEQAAEKATLAFERLVADSTYQGPAPNDFRL